MLRVGNEVKGEPIIRINGLKIGLLRRLPPQICLGSGFGGVPF